MQDENKNFYLRNNLKIIIRSFPAFCRLFVVGFCCCYCSCRSSENNRLDLLIDYFLLVKSAAAVFLTFGY